MVKNLREETFDWLKIKINICLKSGKVIFIRKTVINIIDEISIN
jgi:hypothetical protein